MNKRLADISLAGGLLPSSISSDPTISAVGAAIGKEFRRADESIVNASILSRIDVLTAEILDQLSWQFHVDSWPPNMSLASKRDTVAAALMLHRHKGSVWAVRDALRSIGYIDTEISEGLPRLAYDNQATYSGNEDYTGSDRWAFFSIITDLGEDIGLDGADIAEIARTALEYAPVRCHLKDISYRTTVADIIDVVDETTATVRPVYTDVRPAGCRFDGAINYDQAAQRLFNASLDYDGAADHDGWVTTGETQDNAWDTAEMEIIAISSDSAAVAMDYTGHLIYSGAVTYGHSAPSVVDADLRMVVFRHQYYDGHYDHGGDRYDASHLHNGAINYYTGLFYSGPHQIQEAIL